MKYSDFINEIRILQEKSSSLFNKEEIDHNAEFRKWRHNLTAALDAIKSQNYNVNCNVKRRAFTIGGYSTHEARKNRYNQDLQDTINELETIIKYYNNFGEPKPLKEPNSENIPKKELKYPQKVTLYWLAKHAPIGLWVKFVGMLFAVFVLGLGFSQTVAYKNIQQLWHQEASNETNKQAPNKAPQPTPESGAAEL